MNNKEVLTKKIIVTGGGSGGHISSAKAIIEALNEKFVLNENNFLYVGSDLGMEKEKPNSSLEMKVFKNEWFNQKYIRGGKLQRSFSIYGIYLLLRTILGFIDSFKIIKNFKPDIVISTGGFVSVPVCITAKIHKARIYLHEQTAVIGLSNKIVAKFAEKIFVAYPSSKKYFPKEKVLHTGNLVRNEVFENSGRGGITEFVKKMIVKQEDLPIIYVSGGSLGSHVINEVMKESLLPILQDFQLIIQTGDSKITNDFKLLSLEKEKLTKELKDRLIITKYIGNEEIGFVLNNADLFIGRAGANTVYELGLIRIPSILIPIPWVTHNEQMENAKVLESVGLAKIINEGELTSEKLQVILRLYSKEKISVDEKKANEIFIKNAASKIIANINFN
ncbi:MAG TPA: UDP-N-acetylglucosamine--N-acetylmuramyl-(pentapeptide) pyrophosphoryl-undecaprenol N-acetylglucosamine transferase [Candidatus Pacearchaeota archaeon]|nr:UDP-N-acetylglucosamine--N-acetylmuramyl-(pentapeptide) pyrophosphoryl-undecaprenol N-acetylglucosamine transferase [Candidatus Pacearchaeota archaeon]